MKLPKSVQIKETTSLFANKYNYKIVLVCPGAGWFRGKNYDFTQTKLDEIEPSQFSGRYSKIRSQDDLNYSYKVLFNLRNFNDTEYDTRVENPLISVYTNNANYVEKLASIDADRVKFVCLPNKNLQRLDPGKVVVKTLDFDYKVYLATMKNKDNSSFLNWIKDNDKVRVTKRCIKDLGQRVSWGGSYFYVKDAKTLTMVKMFLGSDISRVEEVIKA
jgi:hypothetical protein